MLLCWHPMQVTSFIAPPSSDLPCLHKLASSWPSVHKFHSPLLSIHSSFKLITHISVEVLSTLLLMSPLQFPVKPANLYCSQRVSWVCYNVKGLRWNFARSGPVPSASWQYPLLVTSQETTAAIKAKMDFGCRENRLKNFPNIVPTSDSTQSHFTMKLHYKQCREL